MKILFAYDGSPSAHVALDDLQFAGLPTASECFILTIADVWLPPEESDNESVVGSLDPSVQARVLAMQQAAKSKVAEAVGMAKHGAELVQSIFPSWKVSSEGIADS